MIDRFLVRLVQLRLDRGTPPGPWLRRWLDARPAAARQAEALVNVDRRLREAGLAMRGGLEPHAITDTPPAVLGKIGSRRATLSVAAMLLMTLSMLTLYTLSASDDARHKPGDGWVAVRPEPADPPIVPTDPAVALGDRVGVLTRFPDRVASALGGLDTLDASAIRTATVAIEAPYRHEADGLAAALANLLPAVRLPAPDPGDESSG
ncbi:MAG: hypothetical protein AAF842_09125 [Planctomycetota bacterium]